MGREGEWLDKNVDLKRLAEGVDEFFRNDGFHEIRHEKDPNGTWFQIQAKKTGVMRTVVSSRKAIHVIIRGNPNNFLVSAGTGEWGKNFAVAGLFTGGIGLIGMGFNLRFTGKLWDHVKKLVESLENTHVEPVSGQLPGSSAVPPPMSSGVLPTMSGAVPPPMPPAEPPSTSAGEGDPLKTLKMRLANGEITEEEYKRMKRIIES